MNYKALEKKLRGIVEKRLEEGWCLRPYRSWDETEWSFFEMEGSGCLMMAVAPDGLSVYGGKRQLSNAGVTDEILSDLEAGFEGWNKEERGGEEVSSVEAYEIGVRIRRDYCEWQ